jgi:hypothetical protein
MNGFSLGARDRRTLVIGLLTVGSIVAVGRGVPAWRRWDQSARVAAADAVRELQAIEGASRQLPAMRDSVAAWRRRLDTLAVMVLEGESPAQAAAALATAVTDAADEAGMLIGSVQVRPDSIYKGSFARVAVRLSATADVTSLAQLLQDLEGGELLLSIRELTVSQPAPAAPANTPEALRLEILVEGLAMHPRVKKL